jgi:predicted RNA methylase
MVMVQSWQNRARQPRRANDAYFTPRWMADLAVVHVVPHLLDGVPATVLEPGAGSGVFVQALRAEWGESPRIYAMEIDNALLPVEGATASGHGDFLAANPLTLPSLYECGLDRFDLVIGNPPFRDAEAFLRQAFQCAKNVAYLLRLNFLASNERVRLFSEYPPYAVWVSPSRPDFTGGGGDYAEYAWFSWRVGYQGPTTLRWLPSVDRVTRRRKDSGQNASDFSSQGPSPDESPSDPPATGGAGGGSRSTDGHAD